MTASNVAESITPARQRQARKVALASFIGTTIEWYDFFIYVACAALIFGPQYFPHTNPVASQLAAFSTFAIAFLARPIGGVLAGHFGDRYGRKRILILTMTGMGAATIGIGALPTYAQIGLAAPALLVLIRVVQGLALGGEYGGAVSMTVETAPRRHRALYAVAVPIGVPAGLILSNGVLLALSTTLGEHFETWGWRIGFLSSFILIIVGLVIRRTVAESPDFEQTSTAERARFPLLDLIRSHPWTVVKMTVVTGVPGLLTNIILSYSLAYGARTVGYTSNQLLLFAVLTSALAMVFFPLLAIATDRIGARRMLIISSTTQVLGGFVFFAGFDSGNLGLAVLAGTLGILTSTAALVAIPSALFSVFSTEIRYTGISITYQAGAAIFAGLAPIAATLLFAQTGTPISIAIYVAVAAVLMLIAVLTMGKSKLASGSDQPSLARST